MDLLDPKTGRSIYVKDDEVNDAIKSGSLGLDTSKQYDMVNQDGQVYRFKANDAMDALNSGFRFEGDQEGHDRNIRIQYGDDNLKAIGAGIARGVSFGLSDLIMTETGMVDPETLAGLKQANPNLSMAGEIGAIGASLLIPGGQVAGLRALRGLGSAPRAAAKVSQVAEGYVARGLGHIGERGLLGKALQKGTALGVGSAVEGALYGGGQWVSENALGNPDDVAENLLGYIGTGALLSGGFGAGLGGAFGIGSVAARKIGETAGDAIAGAGRVVSSGVRKASDGLQSVGTISKETAEGIQNVWEKGTGQGGVFGLVDALTGRPGATKEFFGTGGAAKRAQSVADTKELVGKRAKEAAKGQDAFDAVFDEATDAATGVDKKRAFESMMFSEGSAEMAQSAAVGTVETTLNALESMVSKEARGEYAAPGAIRALRDRFKVQLKKMEDLSENPGIVSKKANSMSFDDQKILNEITQNRITMDDVPEETLKRMFGNLGVSESALKAEATRKATYYGMLDDLKREVGRTRKHMGRIRNVDATVIATKDALADLYLDGFKSMLEDAHVWGSTATAAQREINALWTPYLRRAGFRPKHKFARVYETEDFANVKGGKPEAIRKNDPGSWEDFYSKLGDENQVAMDRAWLIDQTQNKISLMEGINKHYDGKFTEQITTAKAYQKKLLKDLDELESTMGSRNQLESIEEGARQSGLAAMGVGGIAGFALGGVPGAAIGGFVGSLANPANLVRKLATLDRLSARYGSKINSNVDGYVKKVKNLASEAAATAEKRAGRVGEKLEAYGESLKQRPPPPPILRPPDKKKVFITPASVGAIHYSIDNQKEKRAKTKAEAYKKRMNELGRIVNNPQATFAKMEESVEGLARVAPKVTTAMMLKAQMAATYLLDKAPKNPYGTAPYGADRWKPSEAALSKWERPLAVYRDPVGTVMTDLKNGTLSMESVEALRIMYPKIHAQIVTKLSDQMTNVKDPVPYKERVQLSVLFGHPFDPTLEANFVASMQRSQLTAKQDEQDEQRAQAKSKVSSKPTKINTKRAMSDVQRLESGVA